ncbi:hypothetical protein C6W92_12425 [Roseovarius sp. A46]|jgi:hypothetical protein|uniref:Hint domain-containing protein n=1 Tax=Roseovarius sp. A46 TaxID=2109331 RepID=UPI001012B186|nr:Hint domain-containing protein [Roseovarius sp. A46]RXV61221.1 hypothetical protein C6W92_12425 [Roseovarius sp. A46]
MLTYGTKIQTSPDGKSIAVQDLMIGQGVFNPFSDGKDEIIDILARKVLLHETTEELHPVEIARDTFAPGMPCRPLIVSRRQKIMCCPPSQFKKRRREVELVEAVSLPDCKPLTRKEVTYFAIFFAKSRLIVANGSLCATFSADVFQSPQ